MLICLVRPSALHPPQERLTAHLGLITPPGPQLRVGEEVASWRAGQVLLFDDSYYHEAWHDGVEDRYVLYVSLWHPSLPEPVPSDPAWYTAQGEWHPLHPVQL